MNRILACLGSLAVFTAACSAAVIAESTFDSDDQGWRIGEFYVNTGTSAVTYVPTNGNPGGFVQTIDVYDWNAFVAPAAFLGDQSAAYGGSLELDQRVLSSDGVIYPMLVLSDGIVTLQFQTTPAGSDWTSYTIPLTASAGWEVSDLSGNTGPAASEAQLLGVLSNLTRFTLDADWQTGADQVDLDNVRLVSPAATVPEPSSLALMGLSSIGLLSLASRRRTSS